MSLQNALQKARKILKNVQTDIKATHASTPGKVYELVCLAEVVQQLQALGFAVKFKSGHSKVKFKASPGPVNHAYPSFEVTPPNGPGLELWTDVEFLTLSHAMGGVSDLSKCYELDLALTEKIKNGHRPRHDQIVLGVECKARSSGLKDTIKQVLGVRRELSFIAYGESRLCELTGKSKVIAADPPSEFWLFHTDFRIQHYRHGPNHFGITIDHLSP